MPESSYRVSPPFRSLLSRFGEVAVTLSFYSKARAPGPAEHPGENMPVSEPLEPGEPALIVKVSRDGGYGIEKAVAADGTANANVSVMELPEHEFWFFEAFRPALSNLSVKAPGYLFEMALINLYALFEAFVADLIRARLRRFPHRISAKAKRAPAATDRPDDASGRLERAIKSDVRRLTYGSVGALLSALRSELGIATLPTSFDHATQVLALVRNCLLHAGGVVDERLAAADPHYVLGKRIIIDDDACSAAMKVLRDISLALDQADQAVAGA